jgi:hypothetical protein
MGLSRNPGVGIAEFRPKKNFRPPYGGIDKTKKFSTRLTAGKT